MSSINTENTQFVLGTTVVLQSIYYNSLHQPLDADVDPPVSVEIRDAKAHLVQTGLVALHEATGTYRVKYRTAGLREGAYFFVFTAHFGGEPDRKSSKFVLKTVL